MTKKQEKTPIWNVIRDLIKEDILKIESAVSRGEGKATEIKLEGFSDDTSLVIRKSNSVGTAVNYKTKKYDEERGKDVKEIHKHLESKCFEDILYSKKK